MAYNSLGLASSLRPPLLPLSLKDERAQVCLRVSSLRWGAEAVPPSPGRALAPSPSDSSWGSPWVPVPLLQAGMPPGPKGWAAKLHACVGFSSAPSQPSKSRSRLSLTLAGWVRSARKASSLAASPQRCYLQGHNFHLPTGAKGW